MIKKTMQKCATCDLRDCETIVCAVVNAQHAITLIAAESWIFRRIYRDGTPVEEPACWAYVAREDVEK